MRRYISESEGGGSLDVGIGIGAEFGAVEVMRILNEIRESATPQYFGARKGGSIMSNLEVRDGVLYFGACDGNFYALDAVSGSELWRYAAGDVVMAFEPGEGALYLSCYDRCVHAVGFDGRLLWKFKADGKPGAVLFHGGKIYFGTENGSFCCIDSGGSLVWRFSTDSLIGAYPKIHNGLVLFGDFHGRLYALNAETGRRAWTFRGSGGMGGCIVFNDVIYMPARPGVFYAILPGGKELWRRMFGNGLAVDMWYKPPGRMVFASDMEGCLYAMDAKNGETAWTFKAPDIVNIFLAFDGGAVYFGDSFNKFYAADAGTGRLLWSFSTSGPNPGGIVVHNGKVMFGSWDCHVYCLDAKTGTLAWKFRTSIATMSDYVVDRRADKEEVSITVNLPYEDGKKESSEEGQGGEYAAEFTGSYVGKEKGDYVGSGKRSYIRKREF